ncbi:hypothetical protein [Mycoplasma putrefaciens]|uniref:Uncharacterized protein n=2 Tax=Mycoplasma putrefaciens TaxID=2123 RepID=M9WA94_9MOLU|nr:hypothetical protein [Mycoplasma putrefaciens]AEM68629.1 uncharacterized protein MPUT_0247 [Mycoplasma putrefaciens KS1]AGJ90908.1 Hypothetical protein MPUT9231_5000 [Mycoplasma putrefaciens Mput9231]
MSWNISKVDQTKIAVVYQQMGTFKTFAQAVDTAVKMAKTEKLYLDIYSDQNQLLDSLNYTKTLSVQEVYQKSISDLKLARAEKTVSKIELDQRKQDYKTNKDFNQAEWLKQLYIKAKRQYQHKIKAIKYAKFRYKIAKKTFKKSL